ncbi:MAG: CocE/NonD family hydrolase [Alsobacter sp.]
MPQPSASPEVEVTENLFIPLADGTRLAARLWLPSGAHARPVGAVLEYIPYRKRDGTRGRDEPMHGWFAANGLAAIRVDQRGSGESDGFMDDEYLKQEQDDALEVIAWIAAQPWCSGSVGMMGKSWGGFNALQVAARRPPALKAIITVCSTDDRYADDIHYMGGCLLNDNHWWGAIMLAYQARPGDPEILGEAWREQWKARLAHMPFWPALWLAHQRRDAYWKHGSVCEDWSAIQCPVLAVGGWADAYTNAIPRLLEHLHAPRLGIIGPWAHLYPQDGVPGPAIGFLQEAKRWWDHWLTGSDTGIMDEPMLRAFIEHDTPAGAWRPEAPGHWVAERRWPSPAIRPVVLPLAPGVLGEQAGRETEVSFRSPAHVGMGCGEWMGTGSSGEQPADQRIDDGLSLCFDSAPLEADLDLLGAPVLDLELASDSPTAQLAARLCSVAPDGSSRRISYGVLNLQHRRSHEHPEPLAPGRAEPVRVTLNDCGQRIPAGHRLRLALSTGYWPLVWPAAHAATLTLHLAGCRLTLPGRPHDARQPAVSFAPPVSGPPAPRTKLAPGRSARAVEIDLAAGVSRYRTEGEGGLFGEGVLRFDETGTVLSHALTREFAIRPEDPLSAEARIVQTYEMGREGWDIRIETVTELTATAEAFRMIGRLEAFENDLTVAVREWDQTFPREGV